MTIYTSEVYMRTYMKVEALQANRPQFWYS